MKTNLFKFGSIFTLLILSPALVFAAGCDTATGINKIICGITQLLNSLIPLLVAVGLVYFIWGVIRYVIAGEEEDKKKGRDVMVYGIIGLSVIIGIWGIVNMIVDFLGGKGNIPTAPSTTCSMGGNSLQAIATNLTCIINNSAIPLVFALATVMFIWGVVKYFIIDADQEPKRTEGKQFMIWGLVALAVMISVWGLVSLLSGTFGLTFTALPQVHPGGTNPH